MDKILCFTVKNEYIKLCQCSIHFLFFFLLLLYSWHFKSTQSKNEKIVIELYMIFVKLFIRKMNETRIILWFTLIKDLIKRLTFTSIIIFKSRKWAEFYFIKYNEHIYWPASVCIGNTINIYVMYVCEGELIFYLGPEVEYTLYYKNYFVGIKYFYVVL